MSVFRAVNDEQLCAMISRSRKRIAYVAPGISGKVAKALESLLEGFPDLDLTLVLDPDEDVCRIGYGDQAGLEATQKLTERWNIQVRKQSGMRIGVLVCDESVLVWAPTPQSVEAARGDESEPNGILLGTDPVASLEKAIAPVGSDADPSAAEIGSDPVTPADVAKAIETLKDNPVVEVNLSQITRVFSSKLQFVEFEVRNAKLSRAGLTIPKDQLNADASVQLRRLIDGRLRAFGDLRTRDVPVPAFARTGEKSLGPDGLQLKEPMSEADLESRRREIERQFLYPIHDHGTLIARDRKRPFEACVAAFKQQVEAHAEGVRDIIGKQAPDIVDEAIKLLASRAKNAAGSAGKIDTESLRKSLLESIQRLVDGEPRVKLRYKDVTYEHTRDEEFRRLVREVLPQDVQQRLGSWDEHFQAAKEQSSP